MEDNIIKDIRNLFRLKRKIENQQKYILNIYYTAIKDIRKLFRLKKEKEAIKARIIRDIRNLFEHEEDYYKPV